MRRIGSCRKIFDVVGAKKSHLRVLFLNQLTRPARTLFTDVFAYYRGFLAESVTLFERSRTCTKIYLSLFSQFSNLTTFNQHNVLTKVSSSNNESAVVLYFLTRPIALSVTQAIDFVTWGCLEVSVKRRLSLSQRSCRRRRHVV